MLFMKDQWKEIMNIGLREKAIRNDEEPTIAFEQSLLIKYPCYFKLNFIVL
jgi:hypothetical protein